MAFSAPRASRGPRAGLGAAGCGARERTGPARAPRERRAREALDLSCGLEDLEAHSLVIYFFVIFLQMRVASANGMKCHDCSCGPFVGFQASS